ncbi:MAG: hypothetical protein JWQ03_2686 [Variovorax sp.]|nr:hypothetical protein [Variovorax sp.]
MLAQLDPLSSRPRLTKAIMRRSKNFIGRAIREPWIGLELDEATKQS